MDESSAPDQLSYVLIWISRTMFYLLVWLSLAWRLAFQQTISTNACPINLVKKIMIHFHQGGLSLYIYILVPFSLNSHNAYGKEYRDMPQKENKISFIIKW